jgi:hypothetical protein
MGTFNKANALGGNSGKSSRRVKKIKGPPKGEPWVWHTAELMASPAWRSRSITCVRLLNFLEIEHLNHAGHENGALMAPYDQLSKFGLSRCLISEAIDEAEFLGLLRSKRGGRWADTNQPSTYRLTYLSDRDLNPPTNEWKKRSQDQIDGWRARRRERKLVRKKYKQKSKAGAKPDTTVVHEIELQDNNEDETSD